MVTGIKNSVERNLGITTGNLSISCFYHGASSPDKKVLFLVCDGKQPVCMVKMMRDGCYDAQLRRECDAQKKVASLMTLIRVPAILFEDTINGHMIYAETIAPGTPVGKKRAARYLNLISQQQNMLTKGAAFSLQEIARPLGISTDTLSDVPLYRSWSHGDLTCANLVDGKEGLFAIDWERFGERPIWGIDLIHYLIRAFDIKDANHFRRVLADAHLSIDADRDYLEGVYAADTFLDALDKARHEEYERLVISLRAL